MNMAAVKDQDEKATILDQSYHARLLADIENVSAKARIPAHMLHRSVTDFCSKEVVHWLKNWQENLEGGKAGLCLTGVAKGVSIGDQFMAITALFVRHYIDARYITLNRVMEGWGTEDEEDPTVLVIPHLYIKGSGGKGATNWQIQDAYGMLLERFSRGKLTILYVQSIDGMREDYGPVIADHIASCWDTFEA
jgi:hypothetical protein